MSDWFPVRVGLRWGCVMSPWFFNIHRDGLVNAIMLSRGLNLVNSDDSGWKINQLLIADDTALVADWEEKLSVGGRIWASV